MGCVSYHIRVKTQRSMIVIPARLASTRLPRKLLLRQTGKSVLQHTYEAAAGARKPAEVVVATDHPSIAQEVRSFGGKAVLTRSDCQSGTDRVAEIARQRRDVDVLVNVQGDEPEIQAEHIDHLIGRLEMESTASIATLAAPLEDPRAIQDPACVKVVFDGQGRALYFSRSPIPHIRDHDPLRQDSKRPLFYQHIGIYAYRREFLLQFARIPRTPLEIAENLEQLRALETGHTILIGQIAEATRGIDTPQDYQDFVARRRAG